MSAMRVFYLFMALVILLGISLTGFDKVHWFLYVPVVMLFFAGVTGWCTSMWLIRKMGFK